MIKKTNVLMIAAACLLGAAAPCVGQGTETKQDTPATQDAAKQETTKPGEGISIELNKLETADKGCRAYLVINNPTTTSFDAYKLELITFQPDGIIGRRFSIDLAPLLPSKRTVKIFEIDFKLRRHRQLPRQQRHGVPVQCRSGQRLSREPAGQVADQSRNLKVVGKTHWIRSTS